MTYRVEVAPRAARNLGSIYERINAERSLAAAKWFNGLQQVIYALANLPRRCPVAPEGKKQGGLSGIFSMANNLTSSVCFMRSMRNQEW
jgi:plasmid stabilization system protein ParE